MDFWSPKSFKLIASWINMYQLLSTRNVLDAQLTSHEDCFSPATNFRRTHREVFWWSPSDKKYTQTCYFSGFLFNKRGYNFRCKLLTELKGRLSIYFIVSIVVNDVDTLSKGFIVLYLRKYCSYFSSKKWKLSDYRLAMLSLLFGSCLIIWIC